jgi:uncharacterized protein involved in outer membrane biogenesis
MHKAMKLSLRVIGAIAVIYIALMVILFIFVQTKNFNPIVSNYFYQQTGQSLQINGNIKLTLFPWPSISASNIIVNNPKSMKKLAVAPYFVKIKKIRVSLKMTELLHGNINAANILLSGMDINLITLKNGRTNWSGFSKIKQPSHQPTISAKQKSTQQSAKTSKQPPADIGQLPVIQIIQSNAHFINLQTNNQTDIKRFSLRSATSNDQNARQLLLVCQVLHKHPLTAVNLSISTRLKIEKNHTIHFAPLRITSKWTTIKTPLKQPITLQLTGDIQLIHANFTANLLGKFSGSDGSINLNAARQKNRINSTIKITNMNLMTLVEMLTGHRWIDGRINLTTQLKTQGKAFSDWMKYLSGTGDFQIADGKIYGVDIGNLISSTLKQKNTESSNDSYTAFKQISANYQIRRGIFTTNNLALASKNINASGQGRINLPDTTINFKLLTTYAPNPQWQIPIIIHGDLFAPKIQPDTSAIAKKLLKSTISKDLGNTLDKLKKQFNIGKLFD